MRTVFAALLCLAAMAACADQSPARATVDPRTADDVFPRTTAGAGTTGHDDHESFEVLPNVDGTTGSTSDPTTGSTATSPINDPDAPCSPRRSGTTGSGLVPHAPDDGAEALPV